MCLVFCGSSPSRFARGTSARRMRLGGVRESSRGSRGPRLSDTSNVRVGSLECVALRELAQTTSCGAHPSDEGGLEALVSPPTGAFRSSRLTPMSERTGLLPFVSPRTGCTVARVRRISNVCSAFVRGASIVASSPGGALQGPAYLAFGPRRRTSRLLSIQD